jgi:hypothetical protein
MDKTEFREAYEDTHDLLNDALEILDLIYDTENFEERRGLVTNLRATLKLVYKNENALCAGEEWLAHA